jgi:2-polyprenyl-3-methyl-5-hydroxy-6-metoxy-1,4-benzoquinol methylase
VGRFKEKKWGVKMTTNKLKETSTEYGRDYQIRQANKYRNRTNNHWQKRIALSFNLVNKYVAKSLKKSPEETIVADFGCSIGTFAIEFSKLGYQAFGIDSDPSALDVARQLAQEENVTPKFICGDISEWSDIFPSQIDIAICFDIFEHLRDDELGSFLQSVKKTLLKNGYLIFHTFPTQYDYIFFSNKHTHWPLLPFKNIKTSRFDKLVKIYSSLLDVWFLITKGKTHKERIKNSRHCNPLTKERLKDIFLRSGFKIICLESSQLYPFKKDRQRIFYKQPITYRNLFGVVKEE